MTNLVFRPNLEQSKQGHALHLGSDYTLSSCGPLMVTADVMTSQCACVPTLFPAERMLSYRI